MPQPPASQDLLAYRRATAYRETSIFLALAGAVILLAHGVELLHGGRPNWPALAIRVVWAALFWCQVGLLRRGGHRALLAGTAVMILGSAVLDLALLHVTGRSASPLLPFTYVLALTMPLVAFELQGVGVLGGLLLLAGTWLMLRADGVPPAGMIALFNAGGGALVTGWLLGRALMRARLAEETRHLALAEAFRTNQGLVAELREALASVKTLSGLLPVCAWCHRVRSDSGYWEKLEAYVSAHTDATFSHGMCPSCLATRYPEEEPAKEPEKARDRSRS